VILKRQERSSEKVAWRDDEVGYHQWQGLNFQWRQASEAEGNDETWVLGAR
jgi:hypothetical protein